MCEMLRAKTNGKDIRYIIVKMICMFRISKLIIENMHHITVIDYAHIEVIKSLSREKSVLIINVHQIRKMWIKSWYKFKD